MIQFEIDQVKQILIYLDELPYKFSANLIKYIKDIAEPQVAKIQQPFPVAEKQLNNENSTEIN
jgi:hypothetical protein